MIIMPDVHVRFLFISWCMIMSVHMIQVQVHIYIVSTIYHNIVIGHNMHYGRCASYYYSDNCDTNYILLFLTKNTFIP